MRVCHARVVALVTAAVFVAVSAAPASAGPAGPAEPGSHAGAPTSLASSAAFTSFDAVVGGEIFGLAFVNGNIYAAGTFTGVMSRRHGLVPRAYLAAFAYPSGELLMGFDPALDGPAYALEVSANGKLLVGGAFTSVSKDGVTNPGTFAVLNPGGGKPFTVTPKVSGEVRRIALRGASVYVAGRVTKVGSTVRNGVARLSWPSLALDAAFHPVIGDGKVKALAVTRQAVFVGGNFKLVDGLSRGRFFAPLDPLTGALLPGYRNEAPYEVLDLEVMAGSTVVTANGGRGGRVQLRRVADPGQPFAELVSDGDAQAVLPVRGSVWIGGHWDKVSQYGLVCKKLVVWNQPGDEGYCGDEIRGPRGIWDMITLDADHVALAGDIVSVDGVTAGGVVVFDLPPEP